MKFIDSFLKSKYAPIVVAGGAVLLIILIAVVFLVGRGETPSETAEGMGIGTGAGNTSGNPVAAAQGPIVDRARANFTQAGFAFTTNEVVKGKVLSHSGVLGDNMRLSISEGGDNTATLSVEKQADLTEGRKLADLLAQTASPQWVQSGDYAAWMDEAMGNCQNSALMGGEMAVQTDPYTQRTYTLMCSPDGSSFGLTVSPFTD